MVLTPNQIDHIDNKLQLAGYPKSHFFTLGFKLQLGGLIDLAIDAFKRGAKEVSCVPSMFCYGELQRLRVGGNVPLALPFYFEAAIRGHIGSMSRLIQLYQESKPAIACALITFWMKMKIEFDDTTNTEESRKEIKKQFANICYVCKKEKSEENDDVTLVKCGICKLYSYCGKDCQTYHWQELKHNCECRQVILLRKYCKPSYVKEIREAIIGGEDPKKIHTLQRLRMKLGLNRPEEDYKELLLTLANDDDNKNNKDTMKRGTHVKVKGLVKASQHNGKFGIVTKVLIPGEGGRRRVGVKLSDDSDTVLNIKIENLELSSKSATTVTNLPNRPRNSYSNSNSNRPNPYEYLIARKDGTVHIGSTTNTI